MSQTINGRDVLGIAREVTGEVAVEDTSRGAVNKVNDKYEQTVHDERGVREMQRQTELLREMKALLCDIKQLLRRL